jgi:L-amino acid N-acyltransferase YncA
MFSYFSDIHYVVKPNKDLLNQAMNLLDSRVNVAHLLDRDAFSRAFFIVVAVLDGVVIGVATIKSSTTSAKELGFLMVDPNFRRMGIAEKLTLHRILYVRDQGVSLLYSVIKESNLASINNMKKQNFYFLGCYQSAMGSGLWFDWYYLPLIDKGYALLEMIELVGDRRLDDR